MEIYLICANHLPIAPFGRGRVEPRVALCLVSSTWHDNGEAITIAAQWNTRPKQHKAPTDAARNCDRMKLASDASGESRQWPSAAQRQWLRAMALVARAASRGRRLKWRNAFLIRSYSSAKCTTVPGCHLIDFLYWTASRGRIQMRRSPIVSLSCELVEMAADLAVEANHGEIRKQLLPPSLWPSRVGSAGAIAQLDSVRLCPVRFGWSSGAY